MDAPPAASGTLLLDSVIQRGRISPTRVAPVRAATPLYGRKSRPNTPQIECEPPIIDLSGTDANVHNVLLAQRGIDPRRALEEHSNSPTNFARIQNSKSLQRGSTPQRPHTRGSIHSRESGIKSPELHGFDFPGIRGAQDKGSSIITNDVSPLGKSIARLRSRERTRPRPDNKAKPESGILKRGTLPPLGELNSPRNMNDTTHDSLDDENTIAGHEVSPPSDKMVTFEEKKRVQLKIDVTPLNNQQCQNNPNAFPAHPTMVPPLGKLENLLNESGDSPKSELGEKKITFLQYALYYPHPKANAAVMASRKNFETVISLVREYPPCVNDHEEDGSTALHHASIYNHEAAVKVLLDNQADPNALDTMGRTPLHWSSNFGYCNIVQMLLRAGAKPNITDTQGNTPLELSDKRKTWLYLNAWKKFKSAKTVENLCSLLNSEDKELTHMILRDLDEKSEKGIECKRALEQNIYAKMVELSRHNTTDYVCTGEIPNRIHIGRLLARLCMNATLRNQIVELGGISFLNSLARTKEFENQHLAARSLRFITESDQNIETFLKDGGLITMITLADSKNKKILAEAYQPILRLALNSENHELLIRKGGLRSIISMASSENIELRRTSAKILQKMASHSQNISKIASEGALERIGMLLKDSPDIREDALYILVLLSASESVRLPIVEHIGVKQIVDSAHTADIKCKLSSVKILSNISETEELQDHVIESSCLDYIISLFDSVGKEHHESIDHIFVHLAMQEKNRTALAAKGPIPIVSVLRSTNYKSLPKLVGWVVQCLIDIGSRGEPERRFIMKIGGTSPLLSILADADSLPPFLINASCRCISVLCSSPDIVKHFEKVQILSYIIELTKTIKEPKVTWHILLATDSLIRASAQIGLDYVFKGSLYYISAIDKTYHNDERIQTLLDSILGSLTKFETARPYIIESRYFRPFFAAIRQNEHISVVLWSLEALSNLADLSDKRLEILNSGGIELLVSTLKQPSLPLQGRMSIIRCLGTLAEDALHVQGKVVSKAGWAPLLELPPVKNIRYEELCVRTVSILLENEENHAGFITSNGLEKLMAVTLISQTTRYIATSISTVCQNDKLGSMILANGGLELLVSLYNLHDFDVDQHVDDSITHIITNFDNRMKIVESVIKNARESPGWLRILTGIVRSTVRTEDVYSWVANSLIRLADDVSFHTAFLEEDGVAAFELLATCRYPNIQLLGTRGLRILAGARGAHSFYLIPLSLPSDESGGSQS